jgi:hypothetical protein
MSDGDDPRLIGATARENRPSDAGELVGECDRQHVAVEPSRCLLDPRPQTPHRRIRPPCQHDVCGLHEQCPQILVAALGDLAQDVRSPVDSCFGTSPSQAPKSRPRVKPAPLPIAATTALEMIGPTPGTVITRWQPSSCSASASISVDTAAMRSSNRRQFWTSSAMRLTWEGGKPRRRDDSPGFAAWWF